MTEDEGAATEAEVDEVPFAGVGAASRPIRALRPRFTVRRTDQDIGGRRSADSIGLALAEMGSFVHAVEGEMLCASTNPTKVCPAVHAGTTRS